MMCSKCQTELPDDAEFCGVCGQALSIQLPCPHCGRVNPKEFRFCLKCGLSLTELPPQASAPPSVLLSSSPVPTSFANGRYVVKKFLGEGGQEEGLSGS